MKVEFVVATMFLGTTFACAEDAACLTVAVNNYTKANTALMLRSTPIMSVEAIVAQRRLQEQYCLRVARCRVGDSTKGMAIPFAAAFSSCLDNEAKEPLSR